MSENKMPLFRSLVCCVPIPQTTTFETEYSDVDFSICTGWSDFLQNLN